MALKSARLKPQGNVFQINKNFFQREAMISNSKLAICTKHQFKPYLESFKTQKRQKTKHTPFILKNKKRFSENPATMIRIIMKKKLKEPLIICCHLQKIM